MLRAPTTFAQRRFDFQLLSERATTTAWTALRLAIVFVLFFSGDESEGRANEQARAVGGRAGARRAGGDDERTMSDRWIGRAKRGGEQRRASERAKWVTRWKLDGWGYENYKKIKTEKRAETTGGRRTDDGRQRARWEREGRTQLRKLRILVFHIGKVHP